MINNKHTKTNYGPLTDMSKDLNLLFGNNSGRTVSLRTAKGFKTFFDAESMNDDDAEFIVHGGMIAASLLFNSKRQNNQTGGIWLVLALFLFYQLGKK